MTRHLHISLGPVQGFVAQARRTRDLWGGSYLLSLLAAHAMHGARQAGGSIIRPLVDNDRLLQWVERDSDAGSAPPELGSLPNQFTVELDAPTATREELEDLVETVQQRSPIRDTLIRPVDVVTTLA